MEVLLLLFAVLEIDLFSLADSWYQRITSVALRSLWRELVSVVVRYVVSDSNDNHLL